MNDLPRRLAIVTFYISAVMAGIVLGPKIPVKYKGWAPAGTFQVITEEPAAAASFQGNFMDSLRVVIQEKRDKEKEIVFKISPQAEVRILPEKQISLRQFRPVSEFVFVDKKVKHVTVKNGITP